jgi:hypothetical protein
MGVDNYKALQVKQLDVGDLNITAGLSYNLQPAIAPFFVDIQISSLQIKDLVANPIVLVPAIANTVIKPLSITYAMKYGGTNVFTEAGQVMGMFYGSAIGSPATIGFMATGFIDAAVNTVMIDDAVWPVPVAESTIAGQPLILTHSGAEWAGNAGNDNSMTIFMTYVLEYL